MRLPVRTHDNAKYRVFGRGILRNCAASRRMPPEALLPPLYRLHRIHRSLDRGLELRIGQRAGVVRGEHAQEVLDQQPPRPRYQAGIGGNLVAHLRPIYSAQPPNAAIDQRLSQLRQFQMQW